jgi:hypothetical protein
MSISNIGYLFRELVEGVVSPAIDAANNGDKVQIFLDNQDVSQPEQAPFVKITSLPGSHDQVSTGGSTNRYRYTGVFVFSIFVEFGQGDALATGIADAIISTLRDNSTYNGLVLRSASPIRVGRAGKFWQMNVTVPWYFDVIV